MWKRIYNESEDGESTVGIFTGLAGQKSLDILQSVIGQMSDGMWENSPKMEHYWPFIDAVMQGNKVFLVVSKSPWKMGYSKNNWFYVNLGLEETKIKTFMADKIKAVAKQELKDDSSLGKWDRENIEKSGYLSYDTPVTFQEIYFAYEILKGRFCQGKYPEEVVDNMLG